MGAGGPGLVLSFPSYLFLRGFVHTQPFISVRVPKTCIDGRGSAEVKIDRLVRKWGKEISGL